MNFLQERRDKDLYDQLYEILGCSPANSVEQISSEYRRKALKVHPDKGIPDLDSEEKIADFEKLSIAYSILGNRDEKQLYDSWLLGSGLCKHVAYPKWRRLVGQGAMHWNSDPNSTLKIGFPVTAGQGERGSREWKSGKSEKVNVERRGEEKQVVEKKLLSFSQSKAHKYMKPLPELTPAEIATGVRALITITPTLPLHEALELIDKHRINSLVVTSHSDASKFTGIINTFDIVDFVVRFTTPKESTLAAKKEKLNQPVDYLLGLDGEKESYRIKEFDRHDNLSKLLKTFGKKYHRVLVVDFGCPDSVSPYILTQTDIVRFADSHPESLQYVDLNQSLKDSGIIKPSINIIRLTESNTASDGFKLMVENGLTSLPILNSEGKLVANLRAYDAKHIVKLGIEALDWPVLQYLEKSSDGIAPVIASTVDTPLQEIVRKLVIGGVHHVWILSKEGALENVVSMTDLCRYFAVKDKQA